MVSCSRKDNGSASFSDASNSLFHSSFLFDRRNSKNPKYNTDNFLWRKLIYGIDKSCRSRVFIEEPSSNGYEILLQHVTAKEEEKEEKEEKEKGEQQPRVRLVSLKTDKLNGQYGRRMQYNSKIGRYEVIMEMDGSKKAIKPENIEIVTSCVACSFTDEDGLRWKCINTGDKNELSIVTNLKSIQIVRERMLSSMTEGKLRANERKTLINQHINKKSKSYLSEVSCRQ